MLRRGHRRGNAPEHHLHNSAVVINDTVVKEEFGLHRRSWYYTPYSVRYITGRFEHRVPTLWVTPTIAACRSDPGRSPDRDRSRLRQLSLTGSGGSNASASVTVHGIAEANREAGSPVSRAANRIASRYACPAMASARLPRLGMSSISDLISFCWTKMVLTQLAESRSGDSGPSADGAAAP